MFCNNCGKELKDDWVFCDECGCRINLSSEQTGIDNSSQSDNAFQEKEYVFKTFFSGGGKPDIFDLILMIPKTIKGIDMKFFVCENMLIVRQKMKYQDKITGIPYNEIQSFEVKNKFSILSLIGLFAFAAIIISIMVAFAETFLLFLIVLVFTVIYIGITILNTKIKIKVSDGRKFTFTLKRIGSKKQSLKDEFVSEITKMTSQNPTLQNISKQQSKIVIGFTKADWKEAISDVVDDILD